LLEPVGVVLPLDRARPTRQQRPGSLPGVSEGKRRDLCLEQHVGAALIEPALTARGHDEPGVGPVRHLQHLLLRGHHSVLRLDGGNVRFRGSPGGAVEHEGDGDDAGAAHPRQGALHGFAWRIDDRLLWRNDNHMP